MPRFLRIGVVTLLVGIAFMYPLVAPTPHRIDTHHLDMIQHGMNEEDVEAIFGVAAGVYDWATPKDEVTLELLRRNESRTRISGTRYPKVSAWISRHGGFMVEYDGRGHVLNWGMFSDQRGIEYRWQRWWRQFIGRGG